MPTPYLTRASLEQLIGSAEIAAAESATSASIDAVLSSQCAIADGYVSKQTALPPTPAAIEQVAPIVADLVYTALYANAGGEAISKRRAEALKTLRDIAEGTLVLVVTPAGPVEEGTSGAAFGSTPRLASRSQLSEGFGDAGW